MRLASASADSRRFDSNGESFGAQFGEISADIVGNLKWRVEGFHELKRF